MMARSRGLARLPTVATEGWPGSKGLFDAICIIHQGPWEGVVPSTITLNVYDINYNGGWWDTVPGNANWKGGLDWEVAYKSKPSILPPSNHWLIITGKKLSKNRTCVLVLLVFNI